MKTVHILLIEDNEGDIVLTKEAFREGKLANSFSIARDGEEAIDYLYRNGKYADAPRPDLILLDINLPKINGQDLLKVIKDDGEIKAIPVIMLTTSSTSFDVITAYSNHANCYIVKPLEFDKFMDAVKEIESFWFNLVHLPPQN